MKKTLSILAASAAVFGLSVSCTDLTEIEQRLDKVESDIAALQTQVSQLNDNAELLDKLTNATIIKEIRQENGVTIIVTSDNREFEIKDGEKGDPGKTPELTIDEEGNWCVRFGEDEEWIELGKSTPEFSMKDGYWMVKYGNGEFKQLLDPDGNPIEVGTGGVAFDWEINEEGDEFTMTLTDPEDGSERKIVIPILGNKFSVTIDKSGLSPVEGKEGIFQLEYGQVLSVPVTINGLVGDKFEITAPEGWTVQLDDADDADETTYKLLVEGWASAEATASTTKAVIGSTETDVVLKIFSDTYGTAMDKVRFEMVGEATYNPVISKIECTGTVEGALVFNIEYRSAIGYRYLLLAENDETEVTVDMLKTAATSSENTLKLDKYTDGEEQKTVKIFKSYTLYVLAYAEDDIYATEIKQTTATVDDPNVTGFYKEYMMGRDITLGDKTINKATYGPAIFINSDYTLSGNVMPKDNDGNNIHVYFVDSKAILTHTYTNSWNTLIVIGNDPTKKSNFHIMSQVKANTVKIGDAVEEQPNFIHFHNLDIKTEVDSPDNVLLNKTTSTMVVNYDGAFEHIGYTNCYIETDRSMFYNSGAGRSIKNLYVKDCDINYINSKTSNNFLGTGSAVTGTYETLTFINNIFYCSDGGTAVNRIATGADLLANKIVFKKNSVVNICPNTSGQGTAFLIATTENIDITDNLFFAESATVKCGIYRCFKNRNGGSTDEIYSALTGSGAHNLAYAPSAPNPWAVNHGGNISNIQDAEMTNITDNPFEGGIFNLAEGKFIPNDTYKSYGAQR